MENPERWSDDILAARFHEWQPDVARAFAQFQNGRREKQSFRRAWLWVAAALATSVSLAAFPSTRVFAQRCVSACLAGSSGVREFLTGGVSTTAPKNTFAKPGHRMAAPDFALTDASGRAVKLSDFRGKVVLLNFWATWCAPCGAEVPLLVGFQREYRDRGLQVLGVSLDEDGWKSVRPYIEKRQVNYPVMIGNGDIARAYGGLESVPTTVIVDKTGRIAATHLGLCRKDEYEADIQAVLNE
jgi:cytochrome c biogenesis protein CcmG/thiol:disulfide interchange protein DsbE